MEKTDLYYVEQAYRYCKEGIKPTGRVIREKKNGKIIKYVELTCENDEHKPFLLQVNHIKRGRNCPQCNPQYSSTKHNSSNENKQIIEDILNSIGYSLIRYINSKEVMVSCPNPSHRPYNTNVQNIKKGHKCKQCASECNNKYSLNDYYNMSVNLVGYMFDIMNVTKLRYHEARVTRKCKVCGRPSTVPFTDIKERHGCRVCSYTVIGNKGKKPYSYYQSRVNTLGKNKYVLLSITSGEKCTILHLKCLQCGKPFKKPLSELERGSACPRCASSSGEQVVRAILEFNNIDYDPQHPVNISGSIHQLDIILRDKNSNWCVIQPDGEQHFKSTSYMGGEEEFEHRKQMDKDENKYLPALGVKVLRIPWFWFDLNNTLILLQEFLGYDLKKPNIDYVPRYKRYHEIALYYLTHTLGVTASRYRLNVTTVVRVFKKVFGVTKTYYLKQHPICIL